jgi:predicted nucleic acid-binding protein
MHEVPLRRELTCRYPHLTSERVANFYAEVESLAILIPTPPKSFALSRDPDDEIFIDLAVAGAAEYIVTWNARHLTYLTKSGTAEAKDFRTRFPGINILSPPEFLALLDAEQT